MLIELCYPQISFGIKALEVTEEKWEEIQNMTEAKKAEYINENLNESEQDWSFGVRNIRDALNAEYAWIKPKVAPDLTP
ncbi:hypothetical protein [Arundinibacter roseus]|uniref:Uncharacterized protein n=1 Tax=Arundinibacter roseus TaxID=2070510 RepID=A0A4R4K9D6_9BACT|nr:hypothetical protein [Arundinibacter roseus]TDB64387.1 hypothetical protein EZE20_11935 [Arundinibacter roseus]